MAKSNAMVWRETSGTVGKELTITKKRSGSIQIGKHRRGNTVDPTQKQLNIQSRFKMGTIYAKSILKLPDIYALYKAAAVKAKKDQSAYNLAVRDAFIAPEIRNITTALYTGAIGSTITVRAIDDFRVAGVKVSITNAAGVLIEQGDAAMHANGLDWVYVATVLNDALKGSVITVIARDLPANETVADVVL